MNTTDVIITWAKEQGYLFCDGCYGGPDGCGWVDHDDNPVDIEVLYAAAVIGASS